MINLGDKVKDRISGVVGIVVARTEWLYGCVRCTVQPQAKDGKPVDPATIDEPQLVVLKAGAIQAFTQIRFENARPRAAGARPDPVRQPDVTR